MKKISYFKIEKYVGSKIWEYMKFADITSFPPIYVGIFTKPQVNGNNKIYAQACDLSIVHQGIKQCMIIFPADLNKKADYILYHEFTHIMDKETEKLKGVFNNSYFDGYTCYHAAQIELLKLLGVKNIDNKIKFKITDKIKIIGGDLPISVKNYVRESYNWARDAFLRACQADGFSDINTLNLTMELLLNFMGRRSICQLYAEDYDMNLDSLPMTPFNTFFNRYCQNDSNLDGEMESILNGILSDAQINDINKLCNKVTNKIIVKDNLDSSKHVKLNDLGVRIIGILDPLSNGETKFKSTKRLGKKYRVLMYL